MVKGKKLLVLGGTYASYDIVKTAKDMGVYTIVTDNLPADQGSAKQIADEVCQISTNDMKGLKQVISEKNIDGVFCGPSEFNLRNVITLCDMADLPCYATPELWEKCANKDVFKEYCRKNGVPTAQEYPVGCFEEPGKDEEVSYPVIVKPVDGSSSRGISICGDREEVLVAYERAMEVSNRKKVLIEQYIDNGGEIFSFRYILDEGKYYPYLTFDTFIVDPVEKKYLISAFTYFPSKYTDVFLEKVDPYVQKMFRDMGLKNGVAFIQALPYKGEIYCHEMGYRLSGGMIYKITEPLMGINDMKMMIRFALGEKMLCPEEREHLCLKRNDMVLAQLMIPMECGTIAVIDGLDEILGMENVEDFLQYYKEGDTITPADLGTLNQHFGRFTLKAGNKQEMIAAVQSIQEKLRIKDKKGNEMYMRRFDVGRLTNMKKIGGG